MPKLLSKLALNAAVLLLIGVSANSAYADGLVLLGTDLAHPCGVGRGCGDARAPHVLSIQNHTTASGAVGRSATSSEDVRTGDWTRGSNTQTVSLTEIGATQASDIRIYFDIIEPFADKKSDVTLNTLILTAFNEEGTEVFRASLVESPQNFQMVGNGQGTSDYTFGLDAAAAARLQAAIAANPNLRLGLIASVSRADGGPESFFIGSAGSTEPVPEPATMLLLGTGLAGVAAKMRRRRKANAEELDN